MVFLHFIDEWCNVPEEDRKEANGGKGELALIGV